MTPQVSVILPIHDQADHVERVVSEYEQALSRMPHPHEMILAVNGSSDRSHEICRALERRHGTIRVLEDGRAGWGRAVRAGLAAARGEWVCYTNAARTSPQDLLLMILYAITNPGVVIKANRRVREGLVRRFGSLLYNLECRLLFDLPYWDVNGTPKVFPRSFDRLLALTRDDDLIDAEFSSICRREGYPMLEVPVFSVRRHGGRSTTGIRSAVRMYVGAYALWSDARRRAG